MEHQLFQKDISQAIELHHTRLLSSILRSIADDDFNSLARTPLIKLRYQDDDSESLVLVAFPVSASSLFFTENVLAFLYGDLVPLLQVSTAHAYYREVSESVSTFFEMYFRHIMEQSHDPQLSDRQHCILLLDLYYLSHRLFSFIQSSLETATLIPGRQVDDTNGTLLPDFVLNALQPNSMTTAIGFSRPVPEWNKTGQRLIAMYTILQKAYQQRRAKQLAKSTYAFGPACVLVCTLH